MQQKPEPFAGQRLVELTSALQDAPHFLTSVQAHGEVERLDLHKLPEAQFGAYGSKQRMYTVANVANYVLLRMGYAVDGIAAYPSMQQLHSCRGRLYMFLERDAADALDLNGVMIPEPYRNTMHTLQLEAVLETWRRGVRGSLLVNGTIAGPAQQTDPSLVVADVRFNDLMDRVHAASGYNFPWPGDVTIKVRNLPQIMHKQGIAAALLQAAGYDTVRVLVADHYRDAASAVGDRLVGFPDRNVLCAVVRPPADDQQLSRLPRVLQWPGVTAEVKVSVQPSKAIPVGPKAWQDPLRESDSWYTAVKNPPARWKGRAFDPPPQRPFPGASTAGASPAGIGAGEGGIITQQRPDVVEMAAALREEACLAASAAAAAEAVVAAVDGPSTGRRSRRPLFETLQRRLLRTFRKSQLADMVLALTSQHQADQQRVKVLEEQLGAARDLQQQQQQQRQQLLPPPPQQQQQQQQQQREEQQQQEEAQLQQHQHQQQRRRASTEGPVVPVSTQQVNNAAECSEPTQVLHTQQQQQQQQHQHQQQHLQPQQQQPQQQQQQQQQQQPSASAVPRQQSRRRRITLAERQQQAQQQAVEECIQRMQQLQGDWEAELMELQAQLEDQAGPLFLQLEAARDEVQQMESQFSTVACQLRQLREVEQTARFGAASGQPQLPGQPQWGAGDDPVSLTADQGTSSASQSAAARRRRRGRRSRGQQSGQQGDQQPGQQQVQQHRQQPGPQPGQQRSHHQGQYRGQVWEQYEGQLQQDSAAASVQPRQRAAVGILELPAQQAPFAVSFVPEAVERQHLEAEQQARAIAQLDACELSSDEAEDTGSATSGSVTSGSLGVGCVGPFGVGEGGSSDDYGMEGWLEGDGVFDSSDDVGSDYLP